MRGGKVPPAKGRGMWSEIQGKQGTSFQIPLPVEAHSSHFTPPARSCDNTSEMLSPGEVHWRLSTHFLLKPVTLCLAHTKIPNSRRKAGVQHKPHCLYSLGSELLLSFREWWEPFQNPSFQTPAKGQPCKQTSLRLAVTLLCTKGKQPAPIELEE